MSAHAVVEDVRDSERLLETLHAVMHARFGIDHTTDPARVRSRRR